MTVRSSGRHITVSMVTARDLYFLSALSLWSKNHFLGKELSLVHFPRMRRSLQAVI